MNLVEGLKGLYSLSYRCCQIFRTVRLIRSRKEESPGDKERYRLFIAQLQDLSTLGVLEAFMEEAPQVSFAECLGFLTINYEGCNFFKDGF